MKLKVDSSLSNLKEFYGTVYPESEKEAEELSDMIQLSEGKKIKFQSVAKGETKNG